MQEYEPKVNQVSLFREIAKNLVNPLEIIREAISNSHDADSREISITVKRSQSNDVVIEIGDDGNGMDIDGIQRLFNLGDSLKQQNTIGEKGLGTKTYFRSKRIIVLTQTKGGKRYKAIMEAPWERLKNDILPKYFIEDLEPEAGKTGTIITIEGYIVDNPERFFNFETIKDYVLWFSAAGSFKTHFSAYTELHTYIQNLQVAPRVFIEDKIHNKKEEIAGTHRFSPPLEFPPEDPSEQIHTKSVNYCRHFGPFHKATVINGEYVSFQLYGTISGLNCRKKISKLQQGESYKARFGLYLCKDFIPFATKSELIHDSNYHHYHLLLNSQVFDLTADRNNLSNEDDPRVKWVLEEAKKIIENDIKPLAEAGYFKLRKKEEIEKEIRDKQESVKKRKELFNDLDNLPTDKLAIVKRPDCESQVAILFAVMLSNEKTRDLIKGIRKIGHYSDKSATDLICIDDKGNTVLVELEYRLSNLFRHEHPYETFDYVVCWNVDLEVNEKKKTPDGSTLKLVRDQDQWLLKYGPQKVIPIIELRSIMSEVNVPKNTNQPKIHK